MGALSQSQLEKPKHKQEKNVTGLWEPRVGFCGGFRAEPNREELRENRLEARQIHSWAVYEKTSGLPGLVDRCVAPEGIRMAQRVNKGKVNTCLRLDSPGNTF